MRMEERQKLITVEKGDTVQIVGDGTYPILLRKKGPLDPPWLETFHRKDIIEKAVGKGISETEAEEIARKACWDYWQKIGFMSEIGMTGKYTGLSTHGVREWEKSTLCVELEHEDQKVYCMVGDTSLVLNK